MLNYRCLVLDHDDTVVRSEETVNYPSFLEALKVLRPGRTITREEFTRWCFSPGFSALCSDYIGLTPEEIAAAETASDAVASLQAETGEGGLTLEGMLGTGGMEEDVVERLTLRSAMEELPEREQQVLLLRYYKNLTQIQCARVLGVSQVQISRLERRAVDRLRKILCEEEAF